MIWFNIWLVSTIVNLAFLWYDLREQIQTNKAIKEYNKKHPDGYGGQRDTFFTKGLVTLLVIVSIFPVVNTICGVILCGDRFWEKNKNSDWVAKAKEWFDEVV